MTHLLLIRHGSTDAVGRALAGETVGVHLNAHGREEVRGLAARLSRVPLDALYTSPFERTVETARILGEAVGIEPRICEQVAEIRFGRWAGRDFRALAADPLWERFNRFRSGTRIPDGELMIEVQARTIGALVSLCAAHPGQCVAVVSHGDVIKAALAHLLGVALDLMTRIEISTASVSIAELDEAGGRVLCVNDTGNLARIGS